jgi:hypothetical protein
MKGGVTMDLKNDLEGEVDFSRHYLLATGWN